MNLAIRVYDTIQQYHMIDAGDRIIVGVSGGADSICLLHVLRELQGRLQVELRAVHVHHGLRETAERDARYTKACCEAWGIPLRIVYADVRREAAERKQGLEETGREIRYAVMKEECGVWKEQARKETEKEAEKKTEKETRKGPDAGRFRIAVAHHREDCAETVLLNLCRGSSLSGLAGIRGAREEIIRPLIDCSRQDIEEYLRKRGIAWCTDETNADPGYTRNYLRGVILPGLKEHVNSKTAEHICRTAEDLQEAEDFLQQETQKARMACLCADTEEVYSRQRLLGLHPYLRRRVLYAALQDAAGGARDLTFSQVEEMEKLLEGTGTSSVDLPGGRQARMVYDRFRITGRQEDNGREDGDGAPLPMTPEAYAARVFAFDGDLTKIPRGAYTKWFDYDKIGQFPTFRTRQQGDRMAVAAEAHKKLTRIMVDRKIPAALRAGIVLPAAGHEILWMPGGPVHREYLITEGTRTVLELRLRGNGFDDGGKEWTRRSQC